MALFLPQNRFLVFGEGREGMYGLVGITHFLGVDLSPESGYTHGKVNADMRMVREFLRFGN